MAENTPKTTKAAVAASAPFRAADHLHTDEELATYMESMLADGDPRAVPVALRSVVDAVAALKSPAYHGNALRETEQRHEAGQEQPVDWATAKLIGTRGRPRRRKAPGHDLPEGRYRILGTTDSGRSVVLEDCYAYATKGWLNDLPSQHWRIHEVLLDAVFDAVVLRRGVSDARSHGLAATRRHMIETA